MATDNFNRPDETPIAAPWTKAGSGQNLNLASNAMVSPGGADTFYYYSGAASSATQYSQFKVISLGGTKEWGPAVRIKSGATLEGYFVDTFPGSEGIYKYVAGVANLVQAVTYTCAVNDIVRLEAQGSTLRMKVNGSEVTGSPGTDTDIPAAGAGVGVFFVGAPISVDDFDGGDITAPPTPGPGDNPPIGILGRGAGW